MNRFLNVVKAHAAALDRAQAQPRLGIVASVDPARHTARVLLQPDGVLSGWLPVLSPWVGAGWGIACLPVPGAQVLVLAQEGDAEHGIVAGSVFSDAAPPPAAPSGELWLVHRSGASLRLGNDGTIRIQGDVVVSGTITAQDVIDGTGPLSRLRAHYNQHVHPGQSSAGPSPTD